MSPIAKLSTRENFKYFENYDSCLKIRHESEDIESESRQLLARNETRYSER